MAFSFSVRLAVKYIPVFDVSVYSPDLATGPIFTAVSERKYKSET
jgi:hypothetical protein